MKSSTLHRSNLSKERIAVLEELLSARKGSNSSASEKYARTDKDRELDILWQSVRANHKDERSPGVYLSIGFITGALCMFMMSAILNIGNTSEGFSDLNLWKKTNIVSKATPVNITPSSIAQTSAKTEKYVIKSGDTLERVAIKYFGASTPARIQQIQDANGITNPNQIKIGQELTVPVSE